MHLQSININKYHLLKSAALSQHLLIFKNFLFVNVDITKWTLTL